MHINYFLRKVLCRVLNGLSIQPGIQSPEIQNNEAHSPEEANSVEVQSQEIQDQEDQSLEDEKPVVDADADDLTGFEYN